MNEEGRNRFAVLRDCYTMEDLLDIMMFLRSPDGCPWDREQSHKSLISNMVEEAYEVVDAIENNNRDELCEELGDVLMQVVFHAQIAQEENTFTFLDVVTGICRKLISRHTHVFGTDQATTADEVIDTWERNKTKEKGLRSAADSLRKATRSLPALMRSYKVQKKAADVGFDWPDATGAEEKIIEELEEIRAATNLSDPQTRKTAQEEEFGDLLFSVVNYARHMHVQPELALDRACDKFIGRFTRMEEAIEEAGLTTDEMDLAAMDQWWDRTKREEH